MRLAKNHLDVGFSTTDWPAAEQFWTHAVGLDYEEYLKIGAGVRQHRFGVHGSVVKVNHAREALPISSTVHRRLRIACNLVEGPTLLHDPEGVEIELVPPGHDDVVGIEIVNAITDVAATRRFWVDAIGGEEVRPGRYRIGDTLVHCVPTPGLTPMSSRNGAGMRYLTVQVFEVDEEYARIVGLGFRGDMPPTTLGETARIAFVRDPDGMFLEVSQRASLTGSLSLPIL